MSSTPSPLPPALAGLTVQTAGLPVAALQRMLLAEHERFRELHPCSVALAKESREHWLGGVPLHWMQDWGTPEPLHMASAVGATLTDVDAHTYADFCLGDTGAMFGHSPPPVVAALKEQVAKGLTTMLPSAAAPEVGALLAARFGLPWWQVTMTASDANRCVLRWARAITGRQRVLVFDHCYHGQVEDAMVRLDADGEVANRPGLVGQAANLALHSGCIPFNDLPALEAALVTGEYACVLAEPVMTNCGMVLPAPGFHAALRELTRRYGTLLAIDETHTLSTALGGYTRSHGLEPDFFIAGKAVAGGFPCAVYGFTDAVRQSIEQVQAAKASGHSGMGTTLSANPLALAALRANLAEVMTAEAYEHMERLAARLEAGFMALIADYALPWHVSRVGMRLEVGFALHAPQNGAESVAAHSALLGDTLRLYLLNRGVLVTPFHLMMLTSPVTTEAAVDRLLALWREAVVALLGGDVAGHAAAVVDDVAAAGGAKEVRP
jgi:glutamate-1-semialdehyde 2,1-aminomutase